MNIDNIDKIDRLFDEIGRNSLSQKFDNNRKLNDKNDKLHLVNKTPIRTPNDVLVQQYNYRNHTGSLNYSKNMSIKTEPILLWNDYKEPYEEGRSTLLWDTANKYRIKVSGYKVQNDYVPRYASSTTNKLDVVSK